MPVRLVITMNAKPGKGADLLRALEERSVEVRQEPGCLGFEAFLSGNNPDKICLLELWADQAALDVHAGVNATRPPHPGMVEYRGDGPTSREDYEYNRTR